MYIRCQSVSPYKPFIIYCCTRNLYFIVIFNYFVIIKISRLFVMEKSSLAIEGYLSEDFSVGVSPVPGRRRLHHNVLVLTGGRGVGVVPCTINLVSWARSVHHLEKVDSLALRALLGLRKYSRSRSSPSEGSAPGSSRCSECPSIKGSFGRPETIVLCLESRGGHAEFISLQLSRPRSPSSCSFLMLPCL